LPKFSTTLNFVKRIRLLKQRKLKNLEQNKKSSIEALSKRQKIEYSEFRSENEQALNFANFIYDKFRNRDDERKMMELPWDYFMDF